jgi:hypothetical protein
VTWSGPASADTGNRAQDAATTLHNVTWKSSAEGAREARQRELGPLVWHVTGGDGPPIDRLRTAARCGRELIAAGGQRVALIAALTAAAEAAGVARRDAENIIGETLKGAAA